MSSATSTRIPLGRRASSGGSLAAGTLGTDATAAIAGHATRAAGEGVGAEASTSAYAIGDTDEDAAGPTIGLRMGGGATIGLVLDGRASWLQRTAAPVL
jgi:hypothetical protein